MTLRRGYAPHSPGGQELQLMNAIILLCFIAGQVEILVAIVNRSHCLPVPQEWLRRFRHLHHVLLLVCPVVVVGWVGFYEPGVLVGGSWSDISLFWTICFAISLLGFLALVFCSLRWQLRKAPRCHLGTNSRVIDTRELCGPDVVGSGPYQYMTRWPANEFLQVEVAEKTYGLELGGQKTLSILHLSDFHFTGIPAREYYTAAIDACLEREYDLVVFTGDLLDEHELAAWFPETLGRLKARLGCYFILGNHDWGVAPEDSRELFASHGWTDVSGCVVEVPETDGRLVIGGTEVPWMGEHPDFATGPADATRILLSHTPDHMQWARQNNVALVLSGHNHGGQVVLPIIGPVYSPSRTGVKYASGTFFETPTLLHVSRGLGARHPLRIRCRPEVAMLMFEAPE